MWLWNSVPDYEGRIHAPSLTSEATIVRDRHAIPHIFAQTQEDAYFALGYAHAQDRLWQMEMTRRLGSGRLSEIFGTILSRDFVTIDRTMRTLGLYRRARTSMESLGKETRDALQAYALGVNHYLSERRSLLPLEFQLLGHTPEAWRPEDSVVWGKLMSMMLSGNLSDEIRNHTLAVTASAEQIQDLFPDDLFDRSTLSFLKRSDVLARLEGMLPLTFLDQGYASNTWVVDGRQSATGAPLLANDPHLALSAPILWYLARIVTPEWTIVGATVPGVPFHILGQNQSIAWGFTNTHSDTQDFFLEQLASPSSYRFGDRILPLKERTERIRVRWEEDQEVTIRETHRGPIVSEIYPSLNHTLSLRAVTLSEQDTTTQALYYLNHAENWEQFRRAMSFFFTPQQNTSYADKEGNIGFLSPGRIPIRSRGDGALPAPGWEPGYEWNGWIPFDHLPQAYNPPQGRFINANNPPVASDYPYLLSKSWESGYRAKRIQDLLDETAIHTAESAMRIQLDTVSLPARKVLPSLLAVATPRDPLAQEALNRLRLWDGTMSRQDPEPLIYAAWARQITRSLFLPIFRNHLGSYWHWPDALHRIAIGESTARWCPTSDCSEVVTQALSDAMTELKDLYGPDIENWKWGQAHQAALDHRLFSRIPLLRSIFSNRIAADGGNYTLNRGTSALMSRTNPYTQIAGPGYRGVYDLANPERSAFIIASGQSGNPLSPHYDDLTPLWRDGRYVTLRGTLQELRDEGGSVLTLSP